MEASNFPIVEGTVIKATPIVDPWYKVTVKVHRIDRYNADTECEIVTDKPFNEGDAVRFTFEPVTANNAEGAVITGRVGELISVTTESAGLPVIYDKAILYVHHIGNQAVRERCNVIAVKGPKTGENIAYRTVFPTGAMIHATVADIHPVSDGSPYDRLGLMVTTIDGVSPKNEEHCVIVTPRCQDTKEDSAPSFKIELCDPTDPQSIFGNIRAIFPIEGSTLRTLDIDIMRIGNQDLETPCTIILPMSDALRNDLPISFKITPVIQLAGKITKSEPLDGGSYITLDVRQINYRPAHEIWDFFLPKADVKVGYTMEANVILDQNGKLREIVDFEVWDTEGDVYKEPKRGPLHRFCLWICKRCGWLDLC